MELICKSVSVHNSVMSLLFSVCEQCHDKVYIIFQRYVFICATCSLLFNVCLREGNSFCFVNSSILALTDNFEFRTRFLRRVELYRGI